MSQVKSIDFIYKYILDQSIYKVEEGIFYNALFFCTASAMGIKNIRIRRQTNRGEKLIIPNYMGITFAVSGWESKNKRLNSFVLMRINKW